MTKKTRKTSKRRDGKRLNDEGRESPLEVFQLRQEYYSKIARDEIAKGEYGSRQKIEESLRLAQEAAEALAPYRHAKLQATEIKAEVQTKYIARMPAKVVSVDEWLERCAPLKQEAENSKQEILPPEPEAVPEPNPSIMNGIYGWPRLYLEE